MKSSALVVIDLQNDITKNYREIIEAVNNAVASEEFAAFIRANGITEFYIAGADAAACIKSTCYNMTKSGYTVHVLSDCITRSRATIKRSCRSCWLITKARAARS